MQSQTFPRAESRIDKSWLEGQAKQVIFKSALRDSASALADHPDVAQQDAKRMQILDIVAGGLRDAINDATSHGSKAAILIRGAHNDTGLDLTPPVAENLRITVNRKFPEDEAPAMLQVVKDVMHDGLQTAYHGIRSAQFVKNRSLGEKTTESIKSFGNAISPDGSWLKPQARQVIIEAGQRELSEMLQLHIPQVPETELVRLEAVMKPAIVSAVDENNKHGNRGGMPILERPHSVLAKPAEEAMQGIYQQLAKEPKANQLAAYAALNAALEETHLNITEAQSHSRGEAVRF